MRIGELAEATGVAPKTVRYYESIGLLPAPDRRPSGYRDYDRGDVRRLEFVAKAKALGFSLQEIGDILRASSERAVNCDHVVALLEAKRDELDDRIRDAQNLRDAIDHTITAARTDLQRSRDAYHCPVIDHGLHERALHLAGEHHDPAGKGHPHA